MKLNRANRVLALVLAFVVVMSAYIHVDYSRPNLQIALGDDMTYSPAYGAYAPNVNFADGRTMQAPVLGTIARGMTPLHFEATPEDAVRAGELLNNPYDPLSDEGRAAAQRGAEVFRIFCTSCHGGGGAGDGAVAARGFPPPPSMLTGKSLQMKDGQLFHILTYGQGSMTSFAAQLTPDRRWDVINYVRGLQEQAADAQASSAEAAETETTPEPTDQEPPDVPPVDTDTESSWVRPIFISWGETSPLPCTSWPNRASSTPMGWPYASPGWSDVSRANLGTISQVRGKPQRGGPSWATQTRLAPPLRGSWMRIRPDTQGCATLADAQRRSTLG